MAKRKRRSPRTYVRNIPDTIELVWISKRGRTEVNEAALNAPGKHRYYISCVRATPYGPSYWSQQEIAADEEYAIARATSLALTKRRSFQVSRLKTRDEK